MADTRGVFSLKLAYKIKRLDEWVPLNDVWLLAPIPNTGYFGGGVVPGPAVQSAMDKVTYSSDTTAAVPGAALSGGRRGAASTGNSTAGYFDSIR